MTEDDTGTGWPGDHLDDGEQWTAHDQYLGERGRVGGADQRGEATTPGAQPDPGNTDPAELVGDLDADDDVYGRVAELQTSQPVDSDDNFAH